MAQDPLRPKDDGRVNFPPYSIGMNKPTGPGGDREPLRDGENAPELDAEEIQKILARARKNMDIAISAESENRKNGLDDLRFLLGESQWAADVAAQRNFDQRPCLTVNAMPNFVNQVVNDLRQNRPSIHVSPVGDRGDREVARCYRGLIRADERNSHAEEAYDTAAYHMVAMGWGWLRLCTEYEEGNSFNQRLKIERVRNPFTIYMDPSAQNPDGSDANWAFVTELIPKDEFEDLYGDEFTQSLLSGGIGERYPNWKEKDQIRVAEYFEVEKDVRDLVQLSNGFVGWWDDLDEFTRAAIKAGRIEVVKERRSFERKVKWYKITALDILETGVWAGSWIPLVRMLGQEIDIEGKAKYSGIVRNAKDAQRILNYSKTAEVEVTMAAPKAPYVAAEGQLEGHEAEWNGANRKNYAVLTYKPTTLAGKPVPPPQRVPPVPVPAGLVNIQQGAAQDIQRTTGIRFDATVNERMTDESGKAIRELRRSGDLSSFHFADNMTRALRHLGEMMVEMIPKVYDTKRMATIIRDDDSEERVMIDPSMNEASAEIEQGQSSPKLKAFNPNAGKYGVTVTIGPSYATKRIEAAENMMKFAQAMPQQAAIIADLIVKNQDWEGADEMYRRLAKAVPPQLLTPDRKDMSPQVQAAITGMQRELEEHKKQLAVATLQLNDKTADRQLAADKIEKDFEAKLLGIVQKAEATLQGQIGSEIGKLTDAVQQLMAGLAPRQGGASEDIHDPNGGRLSASAL